MYVGSVTGIQQIEIHTVQTLVAEPSPLDIEIAIAKMERYKSPSID
jgi:hypothetical protein